MAKRLTLKKSNCKNCYKRIRHCSVKSIRFSGNQAHIIEDECILCGRCFVVRPQNAKQIVDNGKSQGLFSERSIPPINFNIKMNLVEELSKRLRTMGKRV